MEIRLSHYRAFFSLPKVEKNYLLTVGLVVLVYAIAAKVGLLMMGTPMHASTIWPPSGIALVVLFILGLEYWPGIFAGAFLACFMSKAPLGITVAITLGNTLEAIAGASVLRRAIVFEKIFDSTRTVKVFIIAALASTPIAATIGTLAIVFHHGWSPAHAATTWAVWEMGDIMGDLLLAPFLLTYFNLRSYKVLRGRYLEGGLLLSCLFALCIAIFTGSERNASMMLYLLFPLVIWAAIRFAQLGVVTCVMVVALVALWATSNDIGPFVGAGPRVLELIHLQLYVLVLLATTLVLAMSINERTAAETALVRQTIELERLKFELREANRRATGILETILAEESKRHAKGRWSTKKLRLGSDVEIS